MGGLVGVGAEPGFQTIHQHPHTGHAQFAHDLGKFSRHVGQLVEGRRQRCVLTQRLEDAGCLRRSVASGAHHRTFEGRAECVVDKVEAAGAHPRMSGNEALRPIHDDAQE